MFAKLKEEFEAVEKSNRVNYDRGCEWYDRAEELKTENAKLEEELEAVQSDYVNHRGTLAIARRAEAVSRMLEAENAKLREQLRVKAAGVPFELTRDQMAAFATPDSD